MSPQQHGAVAGRAVPGSGQPNDVEAQQADHSDPAADLFGTWRLAPDAEQYDLASPRAIRLGRPGAARPWVLVGDGDRPGHVMTDDEVRHWPVTPASVVGAAARLHRARTGEPARLLDEAAPAVDTGDEDDGRLFR